MAVAQLLPRLHWHLASAGFAVPPINPLKSPRFSPRSVTNRSDRTSSIH